MQDFNWGAFLLTFVWGIKYKAWITFLAIPLFLIHLPLGLNWFLLIIFQFYCGINGNKWAYEQEWWRKPSDFNKTQIRWAILAVSMNIIIPFIILALASAFITKNPENPKEYIGNGLCTISYNKLKNTLPHTIISINTTSYDIAKQFGKNFRGTKIAGNTVIFNVKRENKMFKQGLYGITFEKPDNENCNIAKGNCTIYVTYIQDVDMDTIAECHYTFNNMQIKPDTKTQKALDKGLNIFKYL